MSARFPIAFVGLLFVCLAQGAADTGEPAIPTAKPVTLQAAKIALPQALAELAKQSGITVEDRRGGGEDGFALDLRGTTFWPALDAIARAANARVDLYARDGKLALVRRPADYTEPPVSYSGLFRTAVKRVAAFRDLETGASAYTATLEVAWEPHLLPFLLETSPRGLVIRDDQGRALKVREEGSAMAPVDGRLALTLDVPLPPVPRTAARLGLLEGKLTAIAPSKMLTFTFDALDRLAEAGANAPLRLQKQDGVSCRLSKVQLTADRWTVQVTLDYPPGKVALESYQSWVVNNEMMLVSKDGSKRLVSGGYVVDSATARRAVVSYHFLDADKSPRGKAADWKVVYRTPAALVEVPLTFSFKDVPLP